jgi:hypothetical protein
VCDTAAALAYETHAANGPLAAGAAAAAAAYLAAAQVEPHVLDSMPPEAFTHLAAASSSCTSGGPPTLRSAA